MVVLGGEDGSPPAGYVVYRTEYRVEGDNDTIGSPSAPGVVDVQELVATDAPAAAALWSYLASIDLTAKVRAWARPGDDPLLDFAADRDQVQVVRRYPALWLRLVDVRAALTARTWAADVDIVLEVEDAALPANAGRFRLTAGPRGVTWGATREPAELSLDVRELAACYLGGTGVARLVRAGLVVEHTPGAARRLDAALATDLLPFTGDDY